MTQCKYRWLNTCDIWDNVNTDGEQRKAVMINNSYVLSSVWTKKIFFYDQHVIYKEYPALAFQATIWVNFTFEKR